MPYFLLIGTFLLYRTDVALTTLSTQKLLRDIVTAGNTVFQGLLFSRNRLSTSCTSFEVAFYSI